jgi:3-deoxy-manno-octulosonate cytidylyltransferase (CMP-KDO synthetase)
MSAICIVSGRMGSTRFPGKVLEHINSREMILWVLEACKKAVGIDNVYATAEETEILNCCSNAGYKTIKTECPNTCSSDQAAEAAKRIDCDVVVDVQSDEPLITADDIRLVIDLKRVNHSSVVNAYAYETHEKESLNSIKCITDGSYVDNLLYASRLPIPYHGRMFKRQVCLYGFYKQQLIDIYGIPKTRGVLEQGEDIHILRCLDRKTNVKMVKLNGKYQSVDIPSDIKKVEDIINNG